MRGIGPTLSRLPVARAFLAGAAILAGASASKAHSQTLGQPLTGADDLALAVPRLSPTGRGGIALPRPLPPSEAARLRRIFEFQRHGRIPEALRETDQLDGDLTSFGIRLGQTMLGHVLADRYLGRFTKPDAGQLQAWLDRFADLPSASAIHSLLLARLPRGASPPAPPVSAGLATATAHPSVPVPEETPPEDMALERNPSLDHAVWDAARAARPDAVNRLLARTRGLSPTYAAVLRGEAGRILFAENRDAEAYDVASAGVLLCARRSAPEGCREAALPGYVAGLAAWRMKRPELARPMFEAAWHAELNTSSMRAAAAFWAARTQVQLGQVVDYRPWMLRAAAESRTFHGLIARRSLGLGFGLGGPDGELLTPPDLDAVAATPAGLTAFALLQIGERDRAEAELRRLWPAAQNTPALARAIMLVASEADLSDLAAQLADLLQAADGRPRDARRFSIPRLRPDGGFKIDPAMVYALARTESDFDATMVSPAGARGLMQIMPETAGFIVGGANGHPVSPARLDDPQFNLDLGQRYVAYLANCDMVNGDLVRLLASYNAGPGGLGRWGGGIRDGGDPLLFIEAIPIDETRAYIPRVLTYMWIYAARLRLPTPSLDELASGSWPRYHPLRLLPAPPVGRVH